MTFEMMEKKWIKTSKLTIFWTRFSRSIDCHLKEKFLTLLNLNVNNFIFDDERFFTFIALVYVQTWGGDVDTVIVNEKLFPKYKKKNNTKYMSRYSNESTLINFFVSKTRDERSTEHDLMRHRSSQKVEKCNERSLEVWASIEREHWSHWNFSYFSLSLTHRVVICWIEKLVEIFHHRVQKESFFVVDELILFWCWTIFFRCFFVLETSFLWWWKDEFKIIKSDILQ